MLPLPAAGAGATGDTTMSSTQHQLIEQCATRLRGIVEALDNIHDTNPQRWSTDLDDVHSSAESLLALINDQAPTQDPQGLAGNGSLRHPCPAHPAQVEQAGDERVIGWRERILAAHPSSDPGFWPDALLVEHMAAEIADLRAALAQPSPAQAEQPTADDYEEVLADHRRLVRELDVLLNGEEGAAKQASLCDLVGQVSAIVRERRVPLLSPSQAEAEQHERLLSEECASALNQRDAALAKIAELDQALAEKDPFGAKLNRISEKLERCDALLVARAAQAGQVPQAWLDVQAERRRQIEAEGWTPEHDDEHDTGALASAAGCYAMFSLAYPAGDPSRFWPWDKSWWKPSPDGRRNMVKAGALILAEIERLDRVAASQGGPSDA